MPTSALEAIAAKATKHLGRDVSVLFVQGVLEGDPFVYEARRCEDDEACGVVLGLATGRIKAA